MLKKSNVTLFNEDGELIEVKHTVSPYAYVYEAMHFNNQVAVARIEDGVYTDEGTLVFCIGITAVMREDFQQLKDSGLLVFHDVKEGPTE